MAELVRNHRNPKPSEIVQRFKFNSRYRKEGESISTYVAELRQLTKHCNFGTALEDMLRDRLVCGINKDRIQRRLLAETTLNFKSSVNFQCSGNRNCNEKCERYSTSRVDLGR